MIGIAILSRWSRCLSSSTPRSACRSKGCGTFRRCCISNILSIDGDVLQPHDADALTRDDCRALDEYLLENGLRAGLKDVLVTHAYDLLEMTRKGQDVGAMISRSQREATTVLNSLFGSRDTSRPRIRRTRRIMSTVTSSEATPTMVKAARR